MNSGHRQNLVEIVKMVFRGRIPADQILAVTFTNKAAKEMAKRVKEVLYLTSLDLNLTSLDKPP